MTTGSRSTSDNPNRPGQTGAGSSNPSSFDTNKPMTTPPNQMTTRSGSMSAEPPPKVAETIDDVSDKAKEVVDRASEGLKQTSANAAMQLQQAQRALNQRAYEAKSGAAAQLRQLAETMRSEVRTGEGQPVQQ